MPARRLTAVSHTRHTINWLSTSREASLLHVFDQACNLINERGELLSVVTRDIGNGPFNLVIARSREMFFSDYLDAQSVISIHADQLCIGELKIDTKNAVIWTAQPDWEQLHKRRDTIARQLMLVNWVPSRASVENFISRLRGATASTTLNADSGSDEMIPHFFVIARSEANGLTAKQSSAEVMGLLRQPSLRSELLAKTPATRELCEAIRDADLQGCRHAAQRLAGVGIGLTPSGDDFLLGAIYATWIIHPVEIARAIVLEIASVAMSLTTSLSNAWLCAATRGEAGEAWHGFLRALAIGNPKWIRTHTNKLLSIGHTSGADALAGFLGLIAAWMGIIQDELTS